MNKNILLGIAGAILLGLIILSFTQSGNIKAKKAKIEEQQENIDGLEKDLALEKQVRQSAEAENERLAEENLQLEEEKESLNKEVSRLKKEIRDLKLRIKTQRETIEGIRAEIAQKENELAGVQQELANLRGKAKRDMQAMRDSLESQLTTLQYATDSILVDKDSLVNQMLDKEEEEEIYKASLEIIEKTAVSYQFISPRKDKDGNEIKNLKKKNWNFTNIEFSLYHEEEGMLEGEEFILKIIDSDTRRVVPMRETNPQYPESEMNQMGLTFMFTSNPVKMTHVNSEEKSGDNYEINLYYLRDGKEFLMHNGMVDIFRNGKPEKIGF